MANVKHLLKKSMNTGASALLLVSTLLPTLGIFPAQNVKAATSTTTGGQALQPSTYDTYDTGDHNYADITSAIRNANAFTLAGTTTVNGNWFEMVNNKGNSSGYALFNGALDMTQANSISGYFQTDSYRATGSANFIDAGDANGFILTPESQKYINTNYNNGKNPANYNRPITYPVAGGLGIGGLPGSIFAGRDLYNNTTSLTHAWDASYDIDGTYQLPVLLGTAGNTEGSSNRISIRTTYNADGTAMVTGNGPNGMPADPGTYAGSGNLVSGTGIGDGINGPNGVASGWNYPTAKYASDPHVNTGVDAIGTESQVDEQMTMTWTPSSTSGSKVTGTLTYTIQSYKPNYTLGVYTGVSSTPNGAVQTISQTLTVPKVMNVGVIGSTGYNYGVLHYSNNTTAVTGARGTAPVQVNYINASTGKRITGYNSSNITANIGDRISISAPGGTTSGNTLKGLPGQYIYSAPTAPTGYSWTTSGTNASKVTYGGSFDSTGKLTGDQATDPNTISGSPSTSYMTVASTADSTTNPNVVNIYYTPATQYTWFNYGNAYTQSGAPSLNSNTYPAYPAGQTGLVGTTITSPTLPAAPTGYHYAGVKFWDYVQYNKNGAANGTVTYWTKDVLGWTSSTANTPPTANGTTSFTSSTDDIKAAMAKATAAANTDNGGMFAPSQATQPANDTISATTLGVTTPYWNTFMAYLEADKITANFTFAWSGGTAPANAPALPSNSSLSGAYSTAIAGAPTYTAPTDYTTSVVVSANGATVGTYSTLAAALAANSKYTGTTASPMTFAVTVSANQNKVNFNYSWAKGTPGATDSGSTTANPGKLQGALPANSTTTAGTGSPLTATPASWLPAGYGVQSVTTPDGNIYTSFTYSGTSITLTGKDSSGNAVTKTGTVSNAPSDLFLATKAVYPTVSSAAVQNWSIVLNALTQSPTLQANFTSAGSGVTLPASFTIPFQDSSGNAFTGLTGAPIPSTIITATENALKAKVSGTTYKNWYLAHYTDPNGNYDPNATNVVLANTVALAGGNLLGTSNKYTAQYDYQGVISFSSPSTIDFGKHLITGTTQNLTGSMKDTTNNPQGVVVNDDRAVPSTGTLSWTLTVAQTKDITSTLGLSFGDSMLNFNGTAMTLNSPITVGSDSASTTGKITTVLPANSTAFKLSAPTALQVPGANYQGEVIWSLQSAP